MTTHTQELPGSVVRHKRGQAYHKRDTMARKTPVRRSPLGREGALQFLFVGLFRDENSRHTRPQLAYSDFEMTPQAIRGGAPPSVSLFTA